MELVKRLNASAIRIAREQKAPSAVDAEIRLGSGQARGIERGARSRAESGSPQTQPAQGGKAGEKIFFGTKPMDPFRINTSLPKSLENKAIAIL